MGRFSKASIDWAPFRICEEGEKPPYPRSLSTPEGLGDRLRFVAFAELQAHHAFALAAESFESLPDQARKIWQTLAKEEKKHLNWLLERMTALGVTPQERPLSIALWNSFDRCETPRDFALFMANAEERGRVAGEKFYETLLKTDPVTAALFQKIAEEEQDHIRLAQSILDLI
jgi:rubrerythrin